MDFTTGAITIRRSNARDETKTGKDREFPLPDALRPVLEEALTAAQKAAPGTALFFPGKKGLQRADAKLSRMLRDALRRAGLVTGYRYSCRRKGCTREPEIHRELEPRRCPKCNFKLWAQGQPIHVRWYDLRHSAASLHRMAGCDPLVVQLVLGHAGENLTDSVYTHLTPEYVRAEFNKLKL